MRADGFAATEVDSAKIWPTMSAYVRPEKRPSAIPDETDTWILAGIFGRRTRYVPRLDVHGHHRQGRA
jgi:hypothetical protein